MADKWWLLIVALLVPLPALSQEPSFEEEFGDLYTIEPDLEGDAGWWGVLSEFNYSGYLKSEAAYRLREPRSITKLRNIAYLQADRPIGESFHLNVSAWAYYDLAYDIFNYDTIAARLERNEQDPLQFVVNLPQEKDSSVADVRELYLDFIGDSLEVRLGKQYIVWGVLEGVRVVDELNPMDFRELILPDLLDYRVPLWSAKADYYTGLGDLQLVWIPDLQFHKPAPAGSEWELLQEVPGTRYPETWTLENSEVGARLSFDVFDTELSFSYLYTWDDFPVIFRTIKVDGSEDPAFFPTYTRMTMYGMTAVRQVGPVVVKGEFAYVEDKYFGRSNIDDQNGDGYVDTSGEAQKDHVRWGLGVDFVFMSWDVAAGVTEWVILDHEEGLIQEEHDTSYNLFLRREFPKYSMTAQYLMIYLQTLEEVYMKPKLFFQLTNNFQVAVGMDLFDGAVSDFGASAAAISQNDFVVDIQQAQFLGNFYDNDRVFIEFKYSF